MRHSLEHVHPAGSTPPGTTLPALLRRPDQQRVQHAEETWRQTLGRLPPSAGRLSILRWTDRGVGIRRSDLCGSIVWCPAADSLGSRRIIVIRRDARLSADLPGRRPGCWYGSVADRYLPTHLHRQPKRQPACPFPACLVHRRSRRFRHRSE